MPPLFQHREVGYLGKAGRPLFYIADWLPPDFGAVGQYAMIFAREFARAGRQVHLIGLSSGAANTHSEECGTGSLEVRRLSARQYDKSRRLNRLWWTLATNWRLVSMVVSNPTSRGADILFTGAPPFMLFFAVGVKYLTGARLIYRITDFYPEVLIADAGRRTLPLALIEFVTWFLRRRVDAFEALGEDQRRHLMAGGISSDRIVLKRDFAPVEVTGHEVPMERPRELSGHMVLLYSGNYGVAHEVDTVVDGLIRHHRDGTGRFALWLNASGSKADIVEQRLRDAGVPIARSQPVALEALPSLLAAADAHLITLRPRFSGIVLPSKVYACISSRKPILYVGPENSDVHLLCSREKGLCYKRIEPGDLVAFATTLSQMNRSLK
jgi:hypothetical protein